MTTLIMLVVLIIVFSSNRSLSRRLAALELKINSGGAPERKPQPINKPGEAPNELTQMQAAPAALAGNTIIPAEEAKPGKFVAWLKEDWLMKLGAALFIVGFGWFISYAFANNWIGPFGRISLGIVAGAILLAWGFRRMMFYPSQGAVFMALGAGMIMLTVFAGRSIYGFFTPLSAVAFDFIVLAFVSFASYKFNLKVLAVIAQVLAFLAPLMVAGQTDSVFLFSYLLFVSIATLFLAGVTGWRELITSSLVFVGLYSVPFIGNSGGIGYYMNSYATDAPLILNFAYVFSMLYLLSGMGAVAMQGVKDAKNEITLAVLNGLFLFSWIYFVAPPEWAVMLFAGWAVIFAAASFLAFRFSSALAPFYAYGTVAVAFIGAATAAELNGAALAIAFTLEVMLLVLIVMLLTKNIKTALSTAWLFIIPAVLSISSVSAYARAEQLFTKDFYVLALLAVSLIVAGRLITNWSSESKGEAENDFGGALVVFGTLYIGYIIWQFVHILISESPDMATMATLFIYTIFGLIAYFAGLYGNDMARRIYGVALLSFVVIRLILVDVWQMELFGRVVTFLAIGVLLMSTAFLTKKKNHE